MQADTTSYTAGKLCNRRARKGEEWQLALGTPCSYNVEADTISFTAGKLVGAVTSTFKCLEKPSRPPPIRLNPLMEMIRRTTMMR